MDKYQEVMKCVAQKHGIFVHTCWIAHVLEMNGVKLRKAHNRKGQRANPCPPSKRKPIEDCLKALKLI